MKLLKNLLALLLVALMVVGCAKPADKPKEGDKTGEKDPGKESGKDDKGSGSTKDTLVVGTPELNGSFYPGFGNNAYDAYVKTLLHDYATYYTDEKGQYQLNKTVVDGEPKVTANADGSKTYQFKIKDGLKFSDGKPISAKDYAFSLLFNASQQWSIAGAANSAYVVYKGFKAYNEGKTNKLEGVKLVDDKTFEVTIDKDQLPYFFELSLATVGPDPMHRFTPDLVIAEDGQSLKLASGATLTDAQKASFKKNLGIEIDNAKKELKDSQDSYRAEKEKAAKANKPFTQEDDKKQAQAEEEMKAAIAELEKKLADFNAGKNIDATKTVLQSAAYEVKNVYRFKPDVTTGPYKFKLFENKTATLELNENYAGNFQGKKPSIKRVVVKYVQVDLDVDSVLNGDIDLAPSVTDAPKIEKAKKATDKVGYVFYNRNGFGLINFLTDSEPVNHKEVRQAIAYLMDRSEFVQQMVGGYGEVVNGEFGISQWQYVAKGKAFNEAIEKRDSIYNLDVNKANALLDKSPYKFEADGKTPFDSKKAIEKAKTDGDNFNYYRYNDKKQILQVNHAGANKQVLNIITSQLPVNGKQVGMKYITNTVDFNVLLDAYYGAAKIKLADRKYQAFSLGVGFYPDSLPYWSYHSSQLGSTNYTRVNDPEADKLTDAMKKTDPKDVDGYANKWLDYQLWYNDYLPSIPLYANQYFDVYNIKLEGLKTAPDWNWAQDIVNLKFK